MQSRRTATFFLIAVCVAFPAVSASAQKPPAWLNDLESAYPDATYLAAQGVGDSKKEAESDAADALARIFNVKVTVDSVARKRYMELASQNKTLSESESSIIQNVGLQSSAQLTNLRYSDPFTDTKGKVYVVAYLDRAQTAGIYRSLLSKGIDLAARLEERAERETGVLHKFALLDSAVQVSLSSDGLLSQLQIIHAPSYKVYAPQVDTASLMALRDAAAKKATYSITIDGDTTGKIASIVKNSLSTLKLSSRADGALAVTGSWAVEPIEVNPKYKSVRWTLNLSFVDETGSEIATFFKEYRENAISDAEAGAFAYRSAKKFVTADFVQSITDYLTRSSAVK